MSENMPGPRSALSTTSNQAHLLIPSSPVPMTTYSLSRHPDAQTFISMMFYTFELCLLDIYRAYTKVRFAIFNEKYRPSLPTNLLNALAMQFRH